MSPARPNLLICYDYFHPAVQAGGIVRSLVNLVTLLSQKIEFKIICRHTDLDGSPLAIPTEQWTPFNKHTTVYYSANPWRVFRQTVKTEVFDAIYFNGMFSPACVFLPLCWLKWQGYQGRVIIAPRGMLHPSALGAKALKKHLYLFLFRQCLPAQAIWHATDQSEVESITRLGFADPIHLVPVLPFINKLTYTNSPTPPPWRLVYLSLIAEKKNLLALLHALVSVDTAELTLDIYGPIKDKNYWDSCKRFIQEKGLTNRVRYLGAIAPPDVPHTLAMYHFFVLPTLNENFGHAIFEALAIGLPVILSQSTPWTEVIQQFNAGFVGNLSEPEWLSDILRQIVKMDPETQTTLSAQALVVANDYLKRNNFISQYQQLFLGNSTQ